jgi:hypothetical protein
MSTGNFLFFKEKCIDELSALQDEFKKLYDMDKYTEWYYDQGLGIFTLTFEGNHIYFKYVDVGSYSQNTNTWKWSWDNEHTPDNVKIGMDKIPLRGKEMKYEELTNGLIEGEAELGWEMTAIANKFINGFGAYRVTSEHLDIYFLFVNEVDSESYKKLKEKYVTCGEHGSRRRAFICQHLNRSTKTGFEESFPSYKDMELEEDDDFQAWCNDCEKVRSKEDGWNDESMKFAKIKVVCEKCYFEIKEFNLGNAEVRPL